ncbi:major facilitator superfamily domain-containing protein [Kalaharituber pfeilii]|nr:major facilitator superfamily domain-containing protein [Kalaharituber pfeilii]
MEPYTGTISISADPKNSAGDSGEFKNDAIGAKGLQQSDKVDLPANSAQTGPDELDVEFDAGRPADSTNPSVKHSFPDGGLHAWLQVVCGFLLMANTWGLIVSWGVFQTHYASLKPPLASPSAISWIGSIQSCLSYFLGAFCGRPFDLGYAKAMTWTGTILITLGLLLTSFSGEFNDTGAPVYWQVILSQGFLLGLGMGCTVIQQVALAASYFKRKRGFAISLCSLGGSVGGMIYPIIIRNMLPKLGYHWTLRAFALIVSCFLMIACLLVKQRTETIDQRPARDGIKRGIKGQLVSGVKLLKDIIWGDWPYITLIGAMFWTCMGIFSPFFYMESFTFGANIDLKGIGSIYLVSTMNVGGAAGRIGSGLLADIIGPVTTQFICITLGAIAVFAWIGIRTIGTLLCFAAVYGALAGAMISLPSTSAARLTSDISVLGTRLGVMFCVFSFATLAGPPITGAFAGMGGDIGQEAAKTWIGSVLLCGGALMLGTRLLKGQPC